MSEHLTNYPTVTLSRREIDDLVRKEIARRFGVADLNVVKIESTSTGRYGK